MGSTSRRVDSSAFVIRRATSDDAQRLADLAASTFRETFGGENTAEDMALHVARLYGPQQQAAEIAREDMRTLLAEIDGRPAAFAQLRRGPAPACVGGSDPVEIWRFYVGGAWIGRGLARRLMAAVVDEAAAFGARTLWLGVWERNARARAFYGKCGFVDVGSHQFLLGEDVQTDRIMARPLSLPREDQLLELKTARLILRPLVPRDLDAAHELWTDPDVRRYLWDDEIISKEKAAAPLHQSAEDFASHGYGLWGVYVRDDQQRVAGAKDQEPGTTNLIGFCGLRRPNLTPDAELLYGLTPAYWHRGLVVEAAHAVLRFGFERLALPAVAAATDPPNAASIRVLERLGLELVRRAPVTGLDTIFYRITAEAFLSCIERS